MIIDSINIHNFRKLKKVHIDLSPTSTFFVGPNNSGKTTAVEALGKFLNGNQFDFNDFTISSKPIIDRIGESWLTINMEKPTELDEWENILPKLDIWLNVEEDEIHLVSHLIPTLEWRAGLIGVRYVYQPKNIGNLFLEFVEAYRRARGVESLGSEFELSLFPNSLSDFITQKLLTHFEIQSYKKDPSLYQESLNSITRYDMECREKNPVKHLIKIDMVTAQRGFSDANSDIYGSKDQLSAQLRRYYDLHLDPNKSPVEEDIAILSSIKKAQESFDQDLKTKFNPALNELKSLGYPGISNPNIIVSTKMNPTDSMKHESALLYILSDIDDSLLLPEKYNGLGYQNLISIVFSLIEFRDGWMKVGKSHNPMTEDQIIEPIHLVIIEEPEAHLHMQVQQVFIKQALKILTDPKKLLAGSYETQLIVSTHSSHIIKETDFSNLRYFKRLPACNESGVTSAEVINLKDVFGLNNQTSKFVTRYIQSTHCDLFFADAAIIVEGISEYILVPHFIKNKFPELNSAYLSILNVGGRHFQRLTPLIDKLRLTTLYISDVDVCDSEGKKTYPERGVGLRVGNPFIKIWFNNENEYDQILDKSDTELVKNNTSSGDYSRRVAYQKQVEINRGGDTHQACSNTFEDSLILTNIKEFSVFDTIEGEVGLFLKSIQRLIEKDMPLTDFNKELYEKVSKTRSDYKADFALDVLYSIDPKKLIVPNYIFDGLNWLNSEIIEKGEKI